MTPPLLTRRCTLCTSSKQLTSITHPATGEKKTICTDCALLIQHTAQNQDIIHWHAYQILLKRLDTHFGSGLRALMAR